MFWHTLGLCGQGCLSKEGRVSFVYSNSGVSEVLLNQQRDTPTSEKLQGMEEMMEFYSYDWFQSPRPPEQQRIGFQSVSTYNAGDGSSDHETVFTTELALSLDQLEDKLVLHLGRIDKIMWASYGPILVFRVKPSKEQTGSYVLVFKLCFSL